MNPNCLLSAAVAVAMLLYGSAGAAPADLDTGFGTDGVVLADVGAYDAYGEGLALLDDGRIVVAGNTNNSNSTDNRFLTMRFLPGGGLDNSFNGSGAVQAVIGTMQSDSAESVALQPDGRIVVAGTIKTGSNPFRSQLAVVRYLPDGTLDLSFNGTGKLVTSFDSPGALEARVTIQPDGKLIVTGLANAGAQYRRIVTLRYHPNGGPDTGFGTGGMVLVQSLPGSMESFGGSAVQADGKIVVGGSLSDTGLAKTIVLRYLPDGAADTGFGNNGMLETDFGMPAQEIWVSAGVFALQRDGKIVLAVTTSYDAPERRVLLRRYTTTGALDTGFNNSGTVATDLPNNGRVYGLDIQPDGKIIAAGQVYTSPSQGFVIRYNQNGSLDQSFNGTGMRLLDIGTQWTWTSKAAVQRDGKILVMGGAEQSVNGADIYLARLQGDSLTGPVLQVEQPLAVVLDSGEARYVGGAAAGGEVTMPFTVFNPGMVTLTLDPPVLDGPDAVAFSISQPPALSVAPGNVTNFMIRFAPATTGPMSAVLRLTGNDVVHSPMEIVLNGTGYLSPLDSDIVVEQPPRMDVPNGGGCRFSDAIAGWTSDLEFSIGNQGPGDLTGLAASITGTDASQFSVFASPPVAVSPGGWARFTVRFSPTSAGLKTATLRLASNDPDENPFEILLTGTGLPVPGTQDTSFFLTVSGTVNCMTVQADRRILLGGSFSAVQFGTRNNVARLLENGALDTSFNYIALGAVNCMAVQLDGRILLGTQVGIVRLLPNGVPDPSFQTPPNKKITGLGLQPDGKVVFVGENTSNSIYRDILRTGPDGILDPGFHPSLQGYESPYWLIVNGDGSFVAAQISAQVGQGSGNALHITTFSKDGVLTDDRYFNSGHTDPDSYRLDALALMEGGGYSYAGDLSRDYYYAPGSPNGSVHQILGQTDSRTLISGYFGIVGGISHSSPARLLKTGGLDPTFVGPAAELMAIQADGKILSPNKRLLNDAAISELNAPDARRVRWLRGGTAPVAIATEFDVSTDGGANWMPLGAGSAITGGWELTGLNLPGNGRLRARARVVSHRSYGVVEELADYTVTPIPHIAVAQNPGGDLTSGSVTPVDFGRISIGGSASRTFTIRNSGWGDLTGLSVTKTGDGQPGDFAITPPAQTLLAHNEETTFSVLLTPTAAGVRTGTLLIASNDPDVNPFQILMTGTRNTASEAWREQYFGTFANTSSAADFSDPDNDGLVNLLEFGTGSHPLEFTPAIGELVKDGANLEFTYSRPVAALTDLSYRVEASSTLSTTWTPINITSTVISDDGITQVVKAIVPAGTGKRFVRLRVTRL